jgi:hypothetical protein
MTALPVQPVAPTEADPAQVAAYMVGLSEQIDSLENERQRAREILIRALGNGTHRLGPGLKVTISPIRRFNEQQAWLCLPAEWLDRVVRSTIDPGLSKSVLPAELYAMCQKESGHLVRVS